MEFCSDPSALRCFENRYICIVGSVRRCVTERLAFRLCILRILLGVRPLVELCVEPAGLCGPSQYNGRLDFPGPTQGEA